MTLGIAVLASGLGRSAAAFAASGTETLSLYFVSPSLGWRLTDRWNPETGARGPLEVQRTTDGGVRWQKISTVTAASGGGGPSFNVYASRILFADKRDGWLYGDVLFATHNGGRTWERLALHGSRTLLSIAGRSIWRLDSSCSSLNVCRYRLLASAAGSNDWHVVTLHLPKVLALMGTLARSGSRRAWIVTGPFLVRNRYTLSLSASRDGGRFWHALPMPCSRGADHSLSAQLVSYSAHDLWLFCASEPGAGNQGKSVFRSSDGGRHWKVVSASGFFGPGPGGLRNLPTYGYLNSVAVTTRSDAWMALGRSTLLHTADGGRTWRPAIPLNVADPGGGGVGQVQFVDRLHGWLFSFPNLLFRTTDGGLRWQKISLERG